MKTFFNLIQEVQKPGLCHKCGGCLTFCTAVNYGALVMDEDGKPKYGDIEKCIECGLCYSICPEIEELEEETKRKLAWSAPIGRVIETTVARSSNNQIREKATDGGVITSLLVHLFDTGKIDGAIVTKPSGPYSRVPCLAQTREGILEAAGFYFDRSAGMQTINEEYMTYSTIEEFAPVISRGLRRVAMVGTPCQINALRRMGILEIVPSDSIKFCFGLFCSGNFDFGEPQREKLAEQFSFNWDDVLRLNVKKNFQIHLKSGKMLSIPIEDLDFIKRHACKYCSDFCAEFADISFGGIGADEGWTTVITRTPLGRAVFADAKGTAVDELSVAESPEFATNALAATRNASSAKKKMARENLKLLGKGNVNVGN